MMGIVKMTEIMKAMTMIQMWQMTITTLSRQMKNSVIVSGFPYSTSTLSTILMISHPVQVFIPQSFYVDSYNFHGGLNLGRDQGSRGIKSDCFVFYLDMLH